MDKNQYVNPIIEKVNSIITKTVQPTDMLDTVTRNALKEAIEKGLSVYVKGLEVKCDDENNPPHVVEDKAIRVSIVFSLNFTEFCVTFKHKEGDVTHDMIQRNKPKLKKGEQPLRNRFEAWGKAKHYDLTRETSGMFKGSYKNPKTRAAWAACLEFSSPDIKHKTLRPE